jgi:hypothetical protein
LVKADDALIVERALLEEKHMVAFLHLIEISPWQNDSYCLDGERKKNFAVVELPGSSRRSPFWAYELNESSISSRRGVSLRLVVNCGDFELSSMSYLTNRPSQIITVVTLLSTKPYIIVRLYCIDAPAGANSVSTMAEGQSINLQLCE